MQVSGFLDEGTNVDPRDTEPPLPLSTVQAKRSQPIPQRGGVGVTGCQSAGRQFSKVEYRLQQGLQTTVGLSRTMPNQPKHATAGRRSSVSRESQPCHPVVSEDYAARHNETRKNLATANSSSSVSRPIPIGAVEYRHQSFQNILERFQIEPPQQRIAPQITPHMEEEADEQEDCDCCDLHSTPRQPLCNEGTKNLCTLAIWAFIIFALCNRFLMHMSLFLHGSGSVKGIVRKS